MYWVFFSLHNCTFQLMWNSCSLDRVLRRRAYSLCTSEIQEQDYHSCCSHNSWDVSSPQFCFGGKYYLKRHSDFHLECYFLSINISICPLCCLNLLQSQVDVTFYLFIPHKKKLNFVWMIRFEEYSQYFWGDSQLIISLYLIISFLAWLKKGSLFLACCGEAFTILSWEIGISIYLIQQSASCFTGKS